MSTSVPGGLALSEAPSQPNANGWHPPPPVVDDPSDAQPGAWTPPLGYQERQNYLLLADSFADAFLTHTRVRWWNVSDSKAAPARRVGPELLHTGRFIAAPRQFCPFLLVDIDRETGVSEIHETLPADLWPSWVIETPRGVQAGWLIHPVDMRAEAKSSKAKAFAELVGQALRAALDGDQQVNPICASKLRNPLYEGPGGVDLRASKTPKVFDLRSMQTTLKKAGLWSQQHRKFTQTAPVAAEPGGLIPVGERNARVFDACRFAAYRGEDAAAAAWAAYDRSDHGGSPFPEREVHGIIKSVEGYMARTQGQKRPSGTTSTPTAFREAMSEFGRKGAATTNAKPEAAKWAAEAAQAGRDAQTARRLDRSVKVAEMTAQGATQGQIAAALRVSERTVRRAASALRGKADSRATSVFGAQPHPAAASEQARSTSARPPSQRAVPTAGAQAGRASQTARSRARAMQIRELAAGGATVREIAAALTVSERTVRRVTSSGSRPPRPAVERPPLVPEATPGQDLPLPPMPALPKEPTELAAEGATRPQIAAFLKIPEKTVQRVTSPANREQVSRAIQATGPTPCPDLPPTHPKEMASDARQTPEYPHEDGQQPCAHARGDDARTECPPSTGRGAQSRGNRAAARRHGGCILESGMEGSAPSRKCPTASSTGQAPQDPAA